jgi:putative oxidoreductase
MSQISSIAAPLGRVLLSILFVFAGVGKLANPAGTIGYIASTGAPFPKLGYAIALIVELGFGVALLVGFQARIVALALAGFSIVTALIFHNNFADQIQMIMFLKNVTIAGGLLLVVAHGAGSLSLDARKA